MNSNNSETSVFGRFHWNINKNVSISLGNITNWTNIFGAFYELTVIVFFAVKFCQKKTGFSEPYYIIYTIGCFIDAAPKILIFFSSYINQNIVTLNLQSFFLWYNSNFIALWNFLLALNRFTAIFYSLDFSKIWSKRNTTFVIIFLMLYPFLIHCFNPSLMWCQITGTYCPRSLSVSVRTTDFEIYFSYISNILYAIVATIMCASAAYDIFIKKRMQNQNVEKVLLIQSLTSSVFLILSSVTSWLADANKASSIVSTVPTAAEMFEFLRAFSVQIFLNAFSDFFYNIHHYIGLLLLLIVSRTFQTKYLEFYKLDKLFKRLGAIFKRKNKVAVVHISLTHETVTVMPRQRHVSIGYLH